jgi:hypothetical protein
MFCGPVFNFDAAVAVVAAGAVPPLIVLLRDGGKAAQALTNIGNNVINRVATAAAGATPLLIALLRDGTESGRYTAASALTSFALDAAHRATSQRDYYELFRDIAAADDGAVANICTLPTVCQRLVATLDRGW